MKRRATRYTHKLVALLLILAIVIILATGVFVIVWAQQLEGPGRPQHQENAIADEGDLFWTLQMM